MKYIIIVLLVFPTISFALMSKPVVRCNYEYRQECAGRRHMVDSVYGNYLSNYKRLKYVEKLCYRGCSGGVKAQRTYLRIAHKNYETQILPSFSVSKRQADIRKKIKAYQKNRYYIRDQFKKPIEHRPSSVEKFRWNVVNPETR